MYDHSRCAILYSSKQSEESLTNEEINEMRQKCISELSKGISMRGANVDYAGIAACAKLLIALLDKAEAKNQSKASGSGGFQSHTSPMVV